MGSLRTFTAEENIRRIKRQKGLKFVVVEGNDDVPIYESCLLSMVSNSQDYDVVFSGGKGTIKDFLEKQSSENCIFIIDKDFNDIGISDTRLVSLDRYSIENYFICENVISCSLQFVLKSRLADVRTAFSLSDFINEALDTLPPLLKVLFYYQRYLVPSMGDEMKFAWGDIFLCKNNDWMLCREKIQSTIEELLPDAIPFSDVEEYYNNNFDSSGSIIKDFPGKLLTHSLQRYIRQQLKLLRPSLGGRVNNVEQMKDLLAASMYRSTDLKNALKPVVEFLDG